MDLDSVKVLQDWATQKLKSKFAQPFFKYTPSSKTLSLQPVLGIHPKGKDDYWLAIRIRNESEREIVEPIIRKACGEVDLRVIENIIPYCLQIGSAIALEAKSQNYGTLGCFVKKPDSSHLFILSNNHVLADINQAQYGDSIVYCSEPDSSDYLRRIASLHDFVHLRTETEGVNFVDAAIAKIEDPREIQLNSIQEYIRLQGLYQINDPATIDNLYGMNVFKLGGRTRYTKGKVTVFDARSVFVDYGNDTRFVCEFSNVVEIESQNHEPFGLPGDSGSIIVDEEGYAIALLFAGDQKSNLIYANPISLVLDELKVQLALE